MLEIITLNAGSNSYLLKNGSDFILIDTGIAGKRLIIDGKIENAGCKNGDLKLIILTHGDIDHVENALFLRNKYSSKIAMNEYDAGMVIEGNMKFNRKPKPDKVASFFKIITIFAPLFIKTKKFDKFTPDILVSDGFDLNQYGFNANIIYTPGHSKGSISLLTDDGNLFCGDLFYNFTGKPVSMLIDNLIDYNSTLEKINGLNIKTIYPGHGKPFVYNK